MRPTPALRMQATRILRSGGGPDPKNGQYVAIVNPLPRDPDYLGSWGNFGSQTQKGVTSYSVSPNRQRPLAGTLHAAFFNVFRRTRHQILFWLPPMIIGYATMEWAIERNEYLNSKPARMAGLAP